MRNNLRKTFLAGLLLAVSLPALGQYTLRVDMTSEKKEVLSRPVGVNRRLRKRRCFHGLSASTFSC